MMDCSHCFIANRAICAGLPHDVLETLGKQGRKQKLVRGQTFAWEGEEALLVANVILGVLKMSVSTPDGREQIVGMVFPADFIGRPFGIENPYSVVALSDVELCVFARATFDQFTRDHPELQNRLLLRTLAELDRSQQWMLLLGKKTATEKMATLLLELSNRLQAGAPTALAEPPCRFTLPLDRQQMGDVLGLTIETVSRQLSKLKDAKLIDLPDRHTVVIRDRLRLQDLAFAA